MAILRYSAVTLLASLVLACSTTPAPVIDRTPAGKTIPGSKTGTTVKSSTASKLAAKPANGKNGSDWRPDTHTVKKGDTLFSIGLEYGYDYKDIARVNNIETPYVIKIGQTLKLSALKDKSDAIETRPTQEQGDGVITYPINNDSNTAATTVNTGTSTPAAIVINEPKATREPYSDEAFNALPPEVKSAAPAGTVNKTSTDTKPAAEIKGTKSDAKPNDAKLNDTKPNSESTETLNWNWPTKGKVISGFNDGGNKGIDIAGSKGQPILAVAPGKVIYSGSDLRGYGKLVIIKHNNTYLSVYANNSNILVKEGQQISSGQKIAEMGDTDSNTVKLHFEIRQQGKSVDPVKFLAPN